MVEVKDLVAVLSKLPGLGRKSASRISSFLLKNKETAFEISDTIRAVSENVIFCSLCGNFTVEDPCSFCKNPNRDNSILCIVEEPLDVNAIEETGYYNGRYHILMGAINPLEGIGPDQLRIKELISRIENGNFTEVLIATNPTTEGEATFLFLVNVLGKYKIKISRIATGIPMGGSLEYADRLTLGKSILSKHYLSD